MRSKKGVFARLVIFALFLVVGTNAYAIVTYGDRPAWESAVGTFQDVTSIDPIPVYTTVTAGTPLALPYGETVSFSINLSRRQVPSGGWGTWSGGHTPAVLFTSGQTSVTGTFSSAVSAFGLEMEPNPFSVLNMTLLLDDGTSLTQAVDGSYGAKFFGWSGGPVTSMTLSCTGADFAFGRMVEGSSAVVPEPASILLLGSGLMGLLGLRKKKRIV